MHIFNKFSNVLMSEHQSKKLFLIYIKHILTIIILPLILCNLILALLFVNTYKMESMSNIRSTAEKQANNIDNLFFQIDTYYKTCLLDYDISTLINNPNSVNNVINTITPFDSAVAKTKLFVQYSNCIDSVYLYSDKSDHLYALHGHHITEKNEEMIKKWYDYASLHNFNSYSTLIHDNDNGYISFYYHISNHGLLVVNSKIQSIIDFFGLVNPNTTELKITSESTGAELFDYKTSDKDSMHIQVPMQFSSAVLSYSEQRKSIFFQSNGSIFFFFLFALLMILLTLLSSIVFSRKQYNSVLSVISAIDAPYFVNGQKHDKMYDIIESEETTTNTSNSFENELLNKITDLKKAQVVALQTQINPHFLFNTLGMISASIVANNGKDTDAVNMISLLSNILRYSLKTETCIVPMCDELDSIEAYISILKLRHQNSFDIETDISDEAYDSYTLKSMIQPIIENSVKHGIQQLFGLRRGKITFKVYTKNNLVYLCVTDNGIGFQPEKLKELTDTLNSDKIFQNENIGLNNVVCRIKLLFGEKAGYSITSDSEHTSVTVYHPFIE